MPKTPKILTITDPRDYDGTPYEVAERAVAQCEGLLDRLLETVEDAAVMARNAEMERSIATDGDPAATTWQTGPQGSRWEAVAATLRGLKAILKGLRLAASYNPKKPPKG